MIRVQASTPSVDTPLFGGGADADLTAETFGGVYHEGNAAAGTRHLFRVIGPVAVRLLLGLRIEVERNASLFSPRDLASASASLVEVPDGVEEPFVYCPGCYNLRDVSFPSDGTLGDVTSDVLPIAYGIDETFELRPNLPDHHYEFWVRSSVAVNNLPRPGDPYVIIYSSDPYRLNLHAAAGYILELAK